MSEQYACVACGGRYGGRGEALECCSDLSTFSTDQATIQDWSAAGFRRASELDGGNDGGC